MLEVCRNDRKTSVQFFCTIAFISKYLVTYFLMPLGICLNTLVFCRWYQCGWVASSTTNQHAVQACCLTPTRSQKLFQDWKASSNTLLFSLFKFSSISNLSSVHRSAYNQLVWFYVCSMNFQYPNRFGSDMSSLSTTPGYAELSQSIPMAYMNLVVVAKTVQKSFYFLFLNL